MPAPQTFGGGLWAEMERGLGWRLPAPSLLRPPEGALPPEGRITWDEAMADSLDFLDISIPSMRGGRRPAGSLSVDYVRDLGEEDLPNLIAPPSGLNEIQPLVRLRHTHHQLARLMAAGEPQVRCAQILGFSQSRISILKNDPAFQELLEYYKAQKDEIFIDVQQRLARLGTDVVEELHSRLEEKPEEFTNNQLMNLAELTLDRSVAPPKGQKGALAQQSGGGGPVSLVINFQAAQQVDPPGGGIKVLDVTPRSEDE